MDCNQERKCDVEFITEINELCDNCPIRTKVSSVRKTMLSKFKVLKSINSKENLVKYLNKKIEKLNGQIEETLNRESWAGDTHRDGRVTIFLSNKDCLQYYSKQLNLIENDDKMEKEEENAIYFIKGGKQVTSEWDFLNQIGTIDRLKEKGVTLNPTHSFELLKETRAQLLVEAKKAFSDGRNLNKLKTGDFELNCFYIAWLKGELETIAYWLGDKYPNGEEKGKPTTSTQIEILKYQQYVNDELQKTETAISKASEQAAKSDQPEIYNIPLSELDIDKYINWSLAKKAVTRAEKKNMALSLLGIQEKSIANYRRVIEEIFYKTTYWKEPSFHEINNFLIWRESQYKDEIRFLEHKREGNPIPDKEIVRQEISRVEGMINSLYQDQIRRLYNTWLPKDFYGLARMAGMIDYLKFLNKDGADSISNGKKNTGRSPKGYTLAQIALIHIYNGINILDPRTDRTREANIIAAKYGCDSPTSGQQLYDKFRTLDGGSHQRTGVVNKKKMINDIESILTELTDKTAAVQELAKLKEPIKDE